MKPLQTRTEKANRKTAAVAGVLFILGTVPTLLSVPLVLNTLSAADPMTAIAANEREMILVTAVRLLMGLACAGIGLALYPVLLKYSPGLAFGAAGFRVMEGMTSVVGAALYVVLLRLSQEFVKAGAPRDSFLYTAGLLINAGNVWLRDVAMLLIFSIGALMYYVIFYQHRLIPRWLSAWGLVGILLTLLSALLVMFQLIPSAGTVQIGLNMVILPQELVLAAWLIAKGIDPSTSAVGYEEASAHLNKESAAC